MWMAYFPRGKKKNKSDVLYQAVSWLGLVKQNDLSMSFLLMIYVPQCAVT